MKKQTIKKVLIWLAILIGGIAIWHFLLNPLIFKKDTLSPNEVQIRLALEQIQTLQRLNGKQYELVMMKFDSLENTISDYSDEFDSQRKYQYKLYRREKQRQANANRDLRLLIEQHQSEMDSLVNVAKEFDY